MFTKLVQDHGAAPSFAQVPRTPPCLSLCLHARGPCPAAHANHPPHAKGREAGTPGCAQSVTLHTAAGTSTGAGQPREGYGAGSCAVRRPVKPRIPLPLVQVRGVCVERQNVQDLSACQALLERRALRGRSRCYKYCFFLLFARVTARIAFPGLACTQELRVLGSEAPG